MATFPKNSRVIFIGDSITAQCKYTTAVADYYAKNLPELNVKFAVGAVSGSTLNHAIKFFDTLVLPFKPTHATVFYGVNDCGLGWLNNEDTALRDEKLKEAYEKYKENLETYIDMLLANDITPILITPAPYAEFIEAESVPYKHGSRLVYEYAEVVRATARRRGLELIDFHARMSELYMTEPDYASPDRVHPTELGQFRLAECFLRAQGHEIGEFKSLSEYLKDEHLNAWRTATFRICRMFGVYVCMDADLFDKPASEQIEIMNEYVMSRGYGTNNFKRDFSTEFVILKPREAQLWARLAEINGD